MDKKSARIRRATRARRKLQELGLVRYENRRFYIPDIKKLSDFRREVKS